jgi:hypothetical protein
MKWLLNIWKKYNPFDIDNTISRIASTVDTMANTIDNLHVIIARDIAELEYANAQKELILQQMIDCLPDMVWFKDVNGKYIYANRAIRDGLLMCSNPVGLDDATLSKKAKEIYGDANHTFGEKCLNSDKITIQNEQPSRFLESGMIKGKMLYLEVNKNIIRGQNGEIIGVCGSGRDLTEYVEAVKDLDVHCVKRCGESKVVEAFRKYEFGE